MDFESITVVESVVEVELCDLEPIVIEVGVPGPPGADGPQGPPGDPGEGVAPGGDANQVLTKVDSTDFNTFWAFVDHVNLLNKGVNTHDQIDAHIASTANPHNVTPGQVGNTTAQWNADQIQSVNVSAAAPADGQVLAYSTANMQYEPAGTAAGAGAIVDTKQAILNTSPPGVLIGFAYDTNEFLLYDTNRSEWYEASIPFFEQLATPTPGARGSGDGNGYYRDVVAYKRLSNIHIGGNNENIEGGLRLAAQGFQGYFDGQWNDFVINFIFREDENDGYELEHIPVGFNEYIEISSGNSNWKGLNGLPLVQQYTSTPGANPLPLTIDGGTF